MRSLLLLASLAMACGGEQNKPEPAPVSPEPAPAQGAPEPSAPAEPAASAIDGGAGSASTGQIHDKCVADCVASRQMQATSPEQIEADCQARCATPTPDLEGK